MRVYVIAALINDSDKGAPLGEDASPRSEFQMWHGNRDTLVKQLCIDANKEILVRGLVNSRN